MFGRRTYHEIAQVVEKEVVPAHTELVSPLAHALVEEIGGSPPLALERLSTEYRLHLRGEYMHFVWAGHGEEAQRQFNQFPQGTTVDVSYRNNLFGLLQPDIVSIYPLKGFEQAA